MQDYPFSFGISLPEGLPSRYDNHITRHLSAMKGQFADQDAYRAMLPREDVVLYQVYEIRRPEVAAEPLHGISIVQPGLMDDECFMTKGHFYSELETAEIY